MTLYHLSRVQAQGWNAANKIPLDEALAMDDAAVAKLNPYANEPELSRWAAGFAEALRK